MENNRKRKYSQITKPDHNLQLQPIFWLFCECCRNRVYNYRLCEHHIIYCSRSCYEVLVLSRKNGYLDEKDEPSFKSPLKRTEKFDDFIEADM